KVSQSVRNLCRASQRLPSDQSLSCKIIRLSVAAANVERESQSAGDGDGCVERSARSTVKRRHGPIEYWRASLRHRSLTRLPKTGTPLSSFQPCHRNAETRSPLQRRRRRSIVPPVFTARLLTAGPSLGNSSIGGVTNRARNRQIRCETRQA